MPGYNVDEEIELLVGHIKRLGRQDPDGIQVTFKVRSEWLVWNHSEQAGTIRRWTSRQQPGVIGGDLEGGQEEEDHQLRARAAAAGYEWLRGHQSQVMILWRALLVLIWFIYTDL